MSGSQRRAPSCSISSTARVKVAKSEAGGVTEVHACHAPGAMRALSIAIVTLLTGCPTGPVDPPADSPDWCDDGRAEFALSSSRGQPIGVWPDDHWTLPADTRTGLRVHLEAEQSAELLAEFPAQWGPLFDDLSTLDGWGLTAGVVFKFRFGIDASSVTEDRVGLVAFTEDGPVEYPLDVVVTDFPDTVIVRPRVPLPIGTQVAAAIFQGVTSTDGTCVRQPPHLRELLSPASELQPGAPAHVLAPRYQQAVQAFGETAANIAALTVFTTQTTPMESVAVAEDVRGRDYAAVGPFDCTPSGVGQRCEGLLPVNDYRGPDRTTPTDFDGTPVASYDLPVTVWLPAGDAPRPVVLGGHGLNSTRHGLDGAPQEMMDLGFAVISADAIQHGDHPANEGDSDELGSVLTFFALTVSPEPSIDPRRLRDNFRQSTWDRLQVLEAIRDGLDVDGDGAPDLDPERMIYFGASLGGMMGSETLALADDLRGGLLAIAGGRLTQVVTESSTYQPLIDLMIPEGYGDDDLARIIPVIQAVADGGDPMVWAGYVVRGRLVGDRADPPQVLVHYVLADQTVNNVSNTNHAAGLGLPGVGREVWSMPEVTFEAGPVQGNLPNGGTAAIQLFDLGTSRSAPGVDPQPLQHGSILGSYESWSVWWPFMQSVAAGEPAIVFDPYAQ